MEFVIEIFVAGIVGLAVGLKILKFEHGKETVITGRDLLAIGLVILGIAAMVESGSFVATGANAGFSLSHCLDLMNLPCFSTGNSGAVAATNSTICTSNSGNCNVQTGVWSPFPRANDLNPNDTTGGACSVGSLTKSASTIGSSRAGDLCQLFNSPNYWQIYPNPSGVAGFTAQFAINCISPAIPTQAGSVLYLQYANYTASTSMWENTSNWDLVPGASSIYVDNTNPGGGMWDCPGHLENTSAGTLPALPANGPTGYIFRIVGVCGCGPSNVTNAGSLGINNVEVIIRHTEKSSFATATQINTVHFLFTLGASFPPQTTTSITVTWLATNETSTTCSSLADHCRQGGTFTCTVNAGTSTCSTSPITQNFPFAFTATPIVLISLSVPNNGWSRIVSDTVPIFSTQIGNF